MNYSEIKTLAISYSDKNDAEVTNNIDNFIRVTEARINRVLQTQEMQIRTSIATVEGQEYYGLPDNFGGMRDIEIRAEEDSRTRYTLSYLSPEQMNQRSSMDDDGRYKIYYTIIANRIQIMPPKDSQVMELVYYRLLTPLDGTNTENWISLSHPDLYLFGMLMEITSFVKDDVGFSLWNQRFDLTLSSIIKHDTEKSFSGTSLQIRLG